MQLVVPSAVRNAVSAATITFTASSITRCFFINCQLSTNPKETLYIHRLQCYDFASAKVQQKIRNSIAKKPFLCFHANDSAHSMALLNSTATIGQSTKNFDVAWNSPIFYLFLQPDKILSICIRYSCVHYYI